MNWPAAIVLTAAIVGLTTCSTQGAPGEQIAVECTRQRGEIVRAWSGSVSCKFQSQAKGSGG